ncbi:hypothetical protein [Salipiger sp. IMCC34102]|uniref:hypothetical protein n=1 Tax=Salipiger sp. IMCC34102 TaxID=2510647 RepID=UPI0013ED0226|nr:hypothetical protein [Salipiger sp. IMCC34102]
MKTSPFSSSSLKRASKPSQYPFSHGAVRGWAHQSDDVAARVNGADRQRLDAIRAMFFRFGSVPDEADVRPRTLSLAQIG